MRVFFFQHGLDEYRGIPGRYAYDVAGRAIDLGRGEKREWQGVVYIDGLAENTPGPNVDPHVLSDLIPWHLSFCNIDRRKRKTAVRGSVPPPARDGAILSEVARPGDIVVFGNYLSTHLFWCDTVLCVGNLVPLPQQNGRLKVLERLHEYWPAATGTTFDNSRDFDRFTSSRTYQLGLRDSTADGGHHQTEIDPHIQVIGCRREPDAVRREELIDELCSGCGFSFIPLRGKHDSHREAIRRRPGLFTARHDGIAAALNGGSGVVALGHVFGRALLRTIAGVADTLVLGSAGLVATALKGSKDATC